MFNLFNLFAGIGKVFSAIRFKEPVRGNYLLNLLYAVDCYLNTLLGGSAKLPLTMVIHVLRRRLNAANDDSLVYKLVDFIHRTINFTTRPIIDDYATDVTKYVKSKVGQHKKLSKQTNVWLLVCLGIPMLPITALFVWTFIYVFNKIGVIPRQTPFNVTRAKAEETLWNK